MTDTEPAPSGTDTVPLPRATPESQGVPSEALLALVRRWERSGLEPHGVLVLRHGHVVAEGSWTPYRPEGVQLVYSVSKTFTACAVGFAVDEGLLRLEDRVVDLFPDEAAAADAGPRTRELTLHDLLAMRTGHRADTLFWRAEEPVPFVQRVLALEPEEERGWFVYHNGATRLAALAVQRAAGTRLLDYLRPRLLDPVGIGPAAWLGSGGADAGYSGLHVTTDALARLGELVLHDGAWQGRQVLPPGWAAAMTTVHTDTSHHPETADWRQGYGYQMWRCTHDAWRADGAYGQFAVVVPGADLVLALTSCTERTQETLDAIWQVLLPALSEGPLPPSADAQEALTAHLGALTLPHPVPASVPDGPGPWVFTHEPTEEVPRLAAVTVSPADDGWSLRVDEGEEVLDVPCGDGAWAPVTGPWTAAGAWTAPGVFETSVCAVESPHVLHLRCVDGTVTASWNGVPLAVPALHALPAPWA
ncbi:serine hydrolase domain-containing protein [Phycicoccus flavus]|uniref:Serine hydrolase n=1 Tax=Phycicoccus flavus TaxID=2502783 RepID=A0A8T6R0B4_9MICO|nr:serine hydrolase [Phycicoccus flavus]NHA67083.1 serine hydrolase [Phycicoccus flavus]